MQSIPPKLPLSVGIGSETVVGTQGDLTDVWTRYGCRGRLMGPISGAKVPLGRVTNGNFKGTFWPKKLPFLTPSSGTLATNIGSNGDPQALISGSYVHRVTQGTCNSFCFTQIFACLVMDYDWAGSLIKIPLCVKSKGELSTEIIVNKDQMVIIFGHLSSIYVNLLPFLPIILTITAILVMNHDWAENLFWSPLGGLGMGIIFSFKDRRSSLKWSWMDFNWAEAVPAILGHLPSNHDHLSKPCFTIPDHSDPLFWWWPTIELLAWTKKNEYPFTGT